VGEGAAVVEVGKAAAALGEVVTVPGVREGQGCAVAMVVAAEMQIEVMLMSSQEVHGHLENGLEETVGVQVQAYLVAELEEGHWWAVMLAVQVRVGKVIARTEVGTGSLLEKGGLMSQCPAHQHLPLLSAKCGCYQSQPAVAACPGCCRHEAALLLVLLLRLGCCPQASLKLRPQPSELTAVDLVEALHMLPAILHLHYCVAVSSRWFACCKPSTP
jgi:hypothetical protein